MDERRNELLGLFGKIIEDRSITVEEFQALAGWFCNASPPLKRAEALFGLNAVSRVFINAVREGRIAMPGHEAAAFMASLWQTVWRCQAIKEADHKVVFIERWRSMSKLLTETQKTLDIAVFNFGGRQLVESLQRKAGSGVRIRILVDDDNVGRVPDSLRAQPTVALRHDTPGRTMHHKFVVSDQERVLTGSMNFTETGFHRSHEGYIITDHPDIVRPYVQEFERLWAAGMPPGP